MKSRILIALTLMVVLLAACGSKAKGPAVPKDFTTACDRANNGKPIVLEGYLIFPESFTGDTSVVLRLYGSSDFSGSPVGVQTEFGTQPNQVEPVAAQFSDTDLKVHLANGQVSQLGDRVKVTGTVYFPAVSQEFACALENPTVELAQ
jgi:hypothetical protein